MYVLIQPFYAASGGEYIPKRFNEDKVVSANTLPPITRSLKGILHDKKVSKEDYHQYLEDKYL